MMSLTDLPAMSHNPSSELTYLYSILQRKDSIHAI
jgi:hypothetical protein